MTRVPVLHGPNLNGVGTRALASIARQSDDADG
jgi:3-dehydroquinate dehydratase